MSTGSMEVKANPVKEASRRIMQLIDRERQGGSLVQDYNVEEFVFDCLTKLHDYTVEHDNNVTDIRVKHWAVKAMAESIGHTLYECGGVNYVTCEILTSRGPVVVTIQRKEGKSPGEIQDELIGMLREVAADSRSPTPPSAVKWLRQYDELRKRAQPNCEKGFRRPSLFARFCFWLATKRFFR